MIQILAESRQISINLTKAVESEVVDQSVIASLAEALEGKSHEVYQAQAIIDLEGPIDAAALTSQLSTAHEEHVSALMDWCQARLRGGDLTQTEQRLDDTSRAIGESLGEFIAEAHFWLNALPEPRRPNGPQPGPPATPQAS
ncbi:hypothetical protein [Streptomyces cinerochromogenes]|uniref:hypothetical protein n=1 Tax=Streptomyces cinerochromogenes TaxID=66422 RepID=UPI00167059B6|nr:hypothetical protein [Streptomyces cinerochromogenes]